MKISVIVTSYNYEQYIKKALDSLVNQTYKNFEVIVIDDGSKDNSVEIIKDYVEKYSNFCLYTHEGNINKGLKNSIELGISKSNGDYIAFLESDDFWSDDYLLEKVSYIKKYPRSAIVINDIQTLGSPIADDYVNDQVKYYRKNYKNNFIKFYNDNGIATFSEVLIRRDVIEKLDFNTPVQPWLDWWLWRQVAINYPISFIDKKLTFWNRHDNSYLTRNNDNIDRRLFKKLSNKMLSKKYPIKYYLFKIEKLLKSFLQDIFSLTNETNAKQKKYKVLKILGFKIKIKKEDKFNPLITVIVPNYNHEKYLNDRLKSIYNQSYKNFEVILMDDCSSDNSRNILNKYYKKYKNKTRIIFNENNSGGVFLQWKKGLENAKGDLIWIAESDDLCTTNFLKELVPSFKDGSVMLSFARNIFVNENNSKQIWSQEEYLYDLPFDWKNKFIETSHNLVNNGFANKNIIPNVSSAIFRNTKFKEIINNDNWYSLKLCGDWLFYLSLMKGGRVAYNSKATNYYRIHNNSTSLKIQKTDYYFKEQAIISKYIASNYKIKLDLFKKQKENLILHAKHNNLNYDEARISELYNLNEINECSNNRKLNILMCIFAFCAGGGETLPIFIANQLKENNESVTILNYQGQKEDLAIKELLNDDIPIVNLSNDDDIVDIASAYGIDIIQTQHGSVDWIVAEKKNELPGDCKHILVTHGMYDCLEKQHLDEKVPHLLNNVDKWLYTTNKNLQPFQHYTNDFSKFYKIRNGLPEKTIKEIKRKDIGISDSSFVLCLVARGIPSKGWIEAIDAVSLARKQTNKDIHLIIIGNGELYNSLFNKVPNFVHLLGIKNNIRDYLNISNMGIVPSRFKGESFPLVIIDALFCNKPVIASNIGEIKNMLSNDDGCIAGSVFDLDDWQIPIDKLANIIGDFSCNEDLYNNAKSVVLEIKDRYKIANVTNSYVEHYKNILKESEKKNEKI